MIPDTRSYSRRDFLFTTVGIVPVWNVSSNHLDLTHRRMLACFSVHRGLRQYPEMDIQYLPDRERPRHRMVFRLKGGPPREALMDRLELVKRDVLDNLGLSVTFEQASSMKKLGAHSQWTTGGNPGD